VRAGERQLAFIYGEDDEKRAEDGKIPLTAPRLGGAHSAGEAAHRQHTADPLLCVFARLFLLVLRVGTWVRSRNAE
jgi:hypothetical protein